MGTTIVVTWTLSRYFYMMAGEGLGVAPLHHAAVTEPLRTLGPYALLIKLATGGMATVFVGNKYGVAGFERLIAVKCCHPHLRDDEEFVTMFLDEARLAARIHHPNVVATLDVGNNSDVLYLVMEYVEGDSLVSLVRRAAKQGAAIPLGVTVRVMIDALTGLHAAHELQGSDGEPLNLVHRDVSPQNILVGADGVSRITDFGIAFAAARSTVTRAGKIKGKFSYMAPEQVRGQEATRRIDTYAAGIVLWEALTGRPLFRRKDDVGTINAVLSSPAPAPSSLMPSVPSALDAIVLKALNRDPAERYQTAEDFAEALEQLPIERATTRGVSAYVESVLGPTLAQRRAQIREASEQALHTFGYEAIESSVHEKPFRPVEEKPTERPGAAETAGEAPVQQSTQRSIPPAAEEQAAVLPAGDIEHRRMRGLLAAAMLLLVGGAVGLLVARSNDKAPPVEKPATTGSARP
jgi:eukaryotic-like serine/threonine-protein kinase